MGPLNTPTNVGLPDGWVGLGGVSNEQWFLQVGHNPKERPGHRYAIWWQNKFGRSQAFTRGKTHPTRESAFMMFRELAELGFDEEKFVEPELPAYESDPEYGRF